ncbi:MULTISPECIES: OmpA family protein [Vibrio]|uniref:OmpA family protein n=1 Tax=Vibrio ostreae TaxID=2841925 RepID=A0A975UB61_9VIBR|nr:MULTISPECIES: OmpA family protein [Vibrio]QXO18427.1 OmpA family protein [Vibrio ostreae]
MTIRNVMIAVLSMTLAHSAYAAQEESSDVYDYMATPVAEQGADLLDDDNDGVINARDKCPQTPQGAQVDNDGCGKQINSSEQQKLHILFASDSSAIAPLFDDQIRQMAEFLQLYPEASIELQGYASKVGSAKYNQALSERRSAAVRMQLIRYGVTPNRIRVIGFGDTVLVADGDDQVSHAQNRRVTATVVGLKDEMLKEWTVFTALPNS